MFIIKINAVVDKKEEEACMIGINDKCVSDKMQCYDDEERSSLYCIGEYGSSLSPRPWYHEM